MAKTLMAFFSRADENYFGGSMRYIEVGNTEVVAQKIKDMIGADLFKIEMKKPYAKDYNTCIAEAKEHQKQDARPELKSLPTSIGAYDTVILGYPNYWGTMPMAVFTFLSFLDPTYTFTVSRKQTAAGCADAMNHIMEQYFCEDSTLLNDGFMEAALKSLMVNAKKCLENPEDYTARAEMMLDCTYGCNGIYSLGNSGSGWPCHGMEHALPAYYDITHGEGLAIITPRWMKHISSSSALRMEFLPFEGPLLADMRTGGRPPSVPAPDSLLSYCLLMLGHRRFFTILFRNTPR